MELVPYSLHKPLAGNDNRTNNDLPSFQIHDLRVKMKAKIYKATIYFVDLDNIHKNFQEFSDFLDDRLSLSSFDIDVAPIGWHDEIDINNHGASQEDYDKYFNITKMTQGQVEERLGYKIEIIE